MGQEMTIYYYKRIFTLFLAEPLLNCFSESYQVLIWNIKMVETNVQEEGKLACFCWLAAANERRFARAPGRRSRFATAAAATRIRSGSRISVQSRSGKLLTSGSRPGGRGTPANGDILSILSLLLLFPGAVWWNEEGKGMGGNWGMRPNGLGNGSGCGCRRDGNKESLLHLSSSLDFLPSSSLS